MDPVLVEVASLPPGYCFACGSVKGPFVDTMSQSEFGRRAYICTPICLPRFAALIGLVDASGLQTELDEAVAEADVLTEQLERQRPLVDAVVTSVSELVEPSLREKVLNVVKGNKPDPAMVAAQAARSK